MKTAIHLKTQKEYDLYMEYARKKGWTWCGQKNYEYKNYWSTYREKTCVQFILKI